MPPDQFQQFKDLLVLVMPIIASVVTLCITNRHNRKIAIEEHRHQREKDLEARKSERIENRYSQRYQAYSTFLLAAEKLKKSALQDEWRGKSSPADRGAELPDLDGELRFLEEANSGVLLVGSGSAATGAEKVRELLQTYYWAWSPVVYGELERGLTEFRGSSQSTV